MECVCSGRAISSWVSLVIVLIAVLASASPVRANFEFSSPRTLSEPDKKGSFPQLVVDSQNRETVVWEATSPDGELRLIQAVRLDADGAPGPVQTLAEMPNGPVNQLWFKWCPCPRLVVDAQGRVTVAWQSFSGTDLRVQAVRLDADGAPGPVRTLSNADDDAYAHQLAVDSMGRVTMAWSLNTESPENKLQSVRLDSDGTPEPVQTLSAPNVDAGGPDVAIDEQDRSTIVWHSGEGVQAVRLAAGGLPGSVQTISPGGEDAGLPQVVIDSQERATVAWWRDAGANEVKAVRLDADSNPGGVQTLSPGGQDTLNPQIAVDRYDRVIVTWEDFNQHVLAVRLGSNGAPGPVYPLSGQNQLAGHPQVATAPDGGAVVVWTHPPVLFIPPWDECEPLDFESASDAVYAAFIGPNGVPGPVRTVSAVGQQSQEARVAFDSLGRPRVVWHSFDGTYFCPDETVRVQSSWGSEVTGAPSSNPPRASSLDTTPPRGNGTLHLGGKGLIRGKEASVQAACVGDSGTTCKGTIRLIARVRLDTERRDTYRGSRRGERRALVARGRYWLAGGERSTLKLGLSRASGRIVGRARWVRVVAIGGELKSRVILLHVVSSGPPPLPVK